MRAGYDLLTEYLNSSCGMHGLWADFSDPNLVIKILTFFQDMLVNGLSNKSYHRSFVGAIVRP